MSVVMSCSGMKDNTRQCKVRTSEPAVLKANIIVISLSQLAYDQVEGFCTKESLSTYISHLNVSNVMFVTGIKSLENKTKKDLREEWDIGGDA